jgi:glycosyltransferase involved in cell wall biosynthesis
VSTEKESKILQIGNYPPPVCGWSIQTKLLVEEFRRRGITCEVLNLSENRRKKSSDYVDVQNIFDYIYKILRFALRGYRFQVHVNGQSRPGYVLALLAALVGQMVRRPIVLSWRGGLHQRYFPWPENSWVRFAFQALFFLSGRISCNNIQVKEAIEGYGIGSERVVAIPAFSPRHLDFRVTPLALAVETFLEQHNPVFFCYVAFRPEYRLPVLWEAMLRFRKQYPRAGFIWLGFPAKELPAASDWVNHWPEAERQGVMVLGNLGHDEFLTLLSRSSAFVRTPACDGVSASVLESLSLGIPVIASENGSRPENVTTYAEREASDLHAKLLDVVERYAEVKAKTRLAFSDDTIVRTVNWVLGESSPQAGQSRRDVIHAG